MCMAFDEPKVTLIGGGSVVWSPIVIVDLMKNFDTGTLALNDLDQEKLQTAHNVAEKLNSHFGNEFTIQSSTDRQELLKGSDFVFFMAEADRSGTWKKDERILQAHGIDHSLSENRGPAGLSHGLRTIPLALDVCRDMEELCPNGICISLTNPEDRIAYACRKYTDIETYGYCSGLWEFRSHLLDDLLGIPGEEVYVDMAGINHLVWVDQVKHRKTGEDLLPKILEATERTDDHSLMRFLYETYGMWPYPDDEHVGEYFGFACDIIECEGYDFDEYEERQAKRNQQNTALVNNELDADRYVQEIEEQIYHVFGDYPMSKIIQGVQGQETYLPSINLPNNGIVDELQDDMIIEVPGVATPGGVKGERFGRLPDPIVDVVRREGTVQQLSAEAAAEGSREKALHALIHDDVVKSPTQAENLLDAFLEEHAEYIQTF